MCWTARGGEFVGPWYTWWCGDPLPALPVLPGFTAVVADDERTLAALARIDIATVAAWRRAGNQPYLAYLCGEPVGYGWTTGHRLEIGELGLSRVLPPGDRYLWGFATVERWRGRGVYRHLLQAIVHHEARGGTRFWIGHTPENRASATSIPRAGFHRVGDVYRLPTGQLVLAPVRPFERARIGAAVLGAALAEPGEEGVKGVQRC